MWANMEKSPKCYWAKNKLQNYKFKCIKQCFCYSKKINKETISTDI